MDGDADYTDPGAPLPALRPLEAIPVDEGGGRRIVIRDPLDLAEGAVVVPVQVYYLMAQLDGESTLRDLQADFASRFGHILGAEEVAEIVRKLDEAYLLDTPRFQEKFRAVQEAFSEAPVRPAFLAGSAYPAEEGEALEAVHGYFTHPEGPGPLEAGVEAGEETSLRALLSPHYDPRRGGFMLAHAFLALARAGKVDRVVVLGTNHQPSTELFTATRKPFATPFGTVVVEDEFLDRVESHYVGDLFGEEFSHRREHSVEFQTLMLAYVWKKLGRGAPPPMVPVLVGSFHTFHDSNPMDDDRVCSFVEGLQAAEADLGGATVYVAGGDLSHIGQRFGDGEAMEAPFLEAVRAEDRALMDVMAGGEALPFHDRIARHQDRYHVCGYPCAYVMLEAAGAGRTLAGSILGYDMAVDPDGAVSYGAMAFTGSGFGS